MEVKVPNEDGEPVDRKDGELFDRINVGMRMAADGQIPMIYANGFLTGQTSGDIVLVLERNSAPTAILNLSFTTAKSLATHLGQTIHALETRTQHEIMTSEMLNTVLGERTDEG